MLPFRQIYPPPQPVPARPEALLTRRLATVSYYFCNRLMRSPGLITSVRRIPNFSFTITTSPWAIKVPFTSTSSGSPASLSSSITEPWLSCSRLRIGIWVLPTSMEMVTGISRITSISGASPLPPIPASSGNSSIGAARTSCPGSSAPSASAMAAAHSSSRPSASLSSEPPVSSMAASHSAASFSSSLSSLSSFLSSSAIASHLQLFLNLGQCRPLMNSQRQLSVTGSQRGLVDRNAIGGDRQMLGHLHRNHIPGLHLGDIPEGDPAPANRCIDRNVHFLDIFLQGVHPALINIVDIALHPGIQHIPNGLNHGIGQGKVQFATATVQFDMEGTDHHHFARADNIGHRRIHFRAQVFEFHLQDRMPGFFHVVENLVQNHLDNTGFGGREFTALNLGVPALPAEEVIHQLEHQLGVQNEQRGATQWAHLAQVETGGHIQGVNIFTELHDLHATGGDVSIPA